MSRERFTDFIRDAILSLPQHLKGVVRIADDPDVPDEGRAVAAGVILHWLSGSNTIPGVRGGVLSYVDDVILLRFACERLTKIAPEAMQRHSEESPELFGDLEEKLSLVRGELGNGMGVIDRAVGKLEKLKHRGRTAAQCVADEEAGTELYDELHSALVDLDLEEEEVGRALRGLSNLVDGLRRQRA